MDRQIVASSGLGVIHNMLFTSNIVMRIQLQCWLSEWYLGTGGWVGYGYQITVYFALIKNIFDKYWLRLFLWSTFMLLLVLTVVRTMPNSIIPSTNMIISVCRLKLLCCKHPFLKIKDAIASPPVCLSPPLLFPPPHCFWSLFQMKKITTCFYIKAPYVFLCLN